VIEKKIGLASGELTYFHAGQGRPLLYLHPAGGVRRSKVLAGLAESYSLYVPVIPGWEGTSFHEGVRTRRQLAALVAECAQRLIGRKTDVMGWSFGGAVALWLALEQPQLVDHLVLECPAGLYNIDPKIKRVNRALLEHYGAADGMDEALAARVGEVAHPSLIIQGTHDGTIPEPSARWLKGQLRKAYLVYMWQAGHDLEVDAPDRVLDVVRRFLEHSDAFMVNRGNIRA
jgi:pimeloyl-ACP methyl ester carboxylesterase